jgi:hypothetical protein
MWEIIEHCLKKCSMFVAVCSENDLVIRENTSVLQERVQIVI